MGRFFCELFSMTWLGMIPNEFVMSSHEILLLFKTEEALPSLPKILDLRRHHFPKELETIINHNTDLPISLLYTPPMI
jgi:hypothetical protein